MTYEQACEILGFTTPKSFAQNAKLATNRLSCMTRKAPLKEKVACKVLIEAAK